MKVFETNPNLKECWKTTDGQHFYTKNAAQNHAATLTDKSVEHMTRPVDSESTEGGKEISIKKLNKQDLINHIKDEYGVDLDEAKTKNELLVDAELIIKEAVEKAALENNK